MSVMTWKGCERKQSWLSNHLSGGI